MPTMDCNSCCWTMAAGALVWILLAAGLAMLSWNKVIAKMVSQKPVKYWQSLLLIVTIGFLFCLPRYASKSCMRDRHGCCKHESCPWSSKDADKNTAENH